MPNITSAIFAIMFKIWALMCIKTTVLVRMVRGPARTAAVTPGCWTMSRTQRVRGTAIGNIAAIAAKASARPSTQPATAILMEAGRNIPAVSTGAKPIAGTAEIRITNTPAIA